MSKYLVSVGDSDKYVVNFDGDLDSFKNSDVYKGIKDKVEEYLKKVFPMGGFSAVDVFHVEKKDDAQGYEELTLKTLPEMLKSAVSQVNVLNRTNLQNLNAPFDKD